MDKWWSVINYRILSGPISDIWGSRLPLSCEHRTWIYDLWQSTPRLTDPKLWRPTYRRPQQALLVSHYFSQCWESLRLPVIAWWLFQMKPRSNHIWTCSHFIGWRTCAFFAAYRSWWRRRHYNGRLKYSSCFSLIRKVSSSDGATRAWRFRSIVRIFIILALWPACDFKFDIDSIMVEAFLRQKNEQRSRLQVDTNYAAEWLSIWPALARH